MMVQVQNVKRLTNPLIIVKFNCLCENNRLSG